MKPAGFTCPSASKLTDACQARLKILKEVFECLSPMALIVNYKYFKSQAQHFIYIEIPVETEE